LLQKGTKSTRAHVSEEAMPDVHPTPVKPNKEPQAAEGADDADVLADRWWGGLPDCDDWRKGKLQKKIKRIEKKIEGIHRKIRKCSEEHQKSIAKLEKKLEHYRGCSGGYGFFVEDGVSEEGVERDGEAAALSESEVDELDGEHSKSEEDWPWEKKKDRLKPCSKLTPKKIEHIIEETEEEIEEEEEGMSECKEDRADDIEEKEEELQHFTECLHGDDDDDDDDKDDDDHPWWKKWR